MTKRPNLRKMFTRDLEFAENTMTLQGGIAPMFIVHGAEKTITVGARFSNYDEKQYAYYVVHTLCIAYNAFALSFIGEAWVAEARASEVRPSLSADRTEVVVVHQVYRRPSGQKMVRSSMRNILRDGERPRLGPERNPAHKPHQMSGAVIDILPLEPSSPEEMVVALKLLEAMQIKPQSSTRH